MHLEKGLLVPMLETRVVHSTNELLQCCYCSANVPLEEDARRWAEIDALGFGALITKIILEHSQGKPCYVVHLYSTIL
mgnify:CR=1 FL=1